MFQKTIGTKKARPPATPSFVEPNINAATAGSPSSSPLPMLLDSSSCSYDSTANTTADYPHGHVPCFSTANAAAVAGSYAAVPTLPSILCRSGGGVGGSVFPSLRSLQENLQLPFFFSTLAAAPPQPNAAGTSIGPAIGSDAAGNGGMGWLSVDRKIGGTELDCMWGF